MPINAEQMTWNVQVPPPNWAAIPATFDRLNDAWRC
jgi:hypothetical protein